jgi:hypothetical protein
MNPQVSALVEGIQGRNGPPNYHHIDALLRANGLRHGQTFVNEGAGAWFMELIDDRDDEVLGAIVMRWPLSKQLADATPPSLFTYGP